MKNLQRSNSVPRITFDKSVKREILDIFGKKVNNKGYIVEKSNPEQKVLTSPDGQEITLNEFAGIKAGSEIFIKKDLISLMKICKKN